MKRPFGRILKGLTNQLLTIIILQTGGQCCSIYNDRQYPPFDPKTTEETSSRSLRQKKTRPPMKAATPWPRWKRKRHWKQTPMKRPGLLAPKWSPGTKGWNKGMAILSICEALLALSNSYISTLEMAILERRYIFPTISFWYVRFRWRSPCNTRILSLGGYPNWKVCLTYFLDCKSHHCRSRAMVAYEVHSLKKTMQTRETWWFLCADFLFCFFFVIIYRCKKLMVLMAKLKQGRKFHVDLALWGIGLPFTSKKTSPQVIQKILCCDSQRS